MFSFVVACLNRARIRVSTRACSDTESTRSCPGFRSFSLFPPPLVSIFVFLVVCAHRPSIPYPFALPKQKNSRGWHYCVRETIRGRRFFRSFPFICYRIGEHTVGKKRVTFGEDENVLACVCACGDSVSGQPPFLSVVSFIGHRLLVSCFREGERGGGMSELTLLCHYSCFVVC